MNSNLQSPPSSLSLPDDVVLSVRGVSKKFCRNLKRSMLYGMQDLAKNMLGLNQRAESRRLSENVDFKSPPSSLIPSSSGLRKDEFWALRDVSFDLKRGECLGLIGRNGSGKTTLLRLLTGIFPPDKGEISIKGRVGAMIALGAGFHPHMTGRENVYLNGSVLGQTQKEVDNHIDEIVDFAEIGDFIDAPVSTYSSGMHVRLGFAIATAIKPDLLLIDEILAVGDAAFRNKCYRRIGNIRKDAAVIFVTHNMEQVARICDSSLVMSMGNVVHLGDTTAGISYYDRLNESREDNSDSFLSIQPPISNFTYEVLPSDIQVGETLRLGIICKTFQVMTKFVLRITIFNASGAYAADCNISSLEQGIVMKAGENRWEIKVDPLSLRRGKYFVSVQILDLSGDFLVWSHKQRRINMTGGYPGAVADYQLPLRRWCYCDGKDGLVSFGDTGH